MMAVGYAALAWHERVVSKGEMTGRYLVSSYENSGSIF
jgi:hypothetical protein